MSGSEWNDLYSISYEFLAGIFHIIFQVQELSIHPVSCLADAMDLLAKGCHLRSKGQTAMNDKSSRSHAIFTLTVEGKESEERFEN